MQETSRRGLPLSGLESARYWTSRELGGLELLEGRFRKHAYRPHMHPGYVIAVVTGGVEALKCRGRLHRAGSGDIIFVNPETLHDGQSGAEEGWRYRVFYPDIAMMRALTPDAPGQGPPMFRETVVHDLDLADGLARLHGSLAGGADALRVEAAWLSLLAKALTRHADARTIMTPPRDSRRIRQAKALIASEDPAARSLSGLAAQVGLSPFHLLRIFQAEVGATPHAYRIACRVRRAKGLMDHGEPPAQAAAATGFVDQSHLSRHFKAAYGVTPGQYIVSRAS